MKTFRYFFPILGFVFACENSKLGNDTSHQNKKITNSMEENPPGSLAVEGSDLNPISTSKPETRPGINLKNQVPTLNPNSKIDPILTPISVQTFLIDPDKDQILTLAQGTIIGFEANAFEQKGKPVSAPVTIKVKEYTRLTDFLADSLATVSNGQLLETGGSLDICAFSNGLPCDLRKGRPIRIAFRRNTESPGMETFLGKRTKGQINWIREAESVISPSSNTWEMDSESTSKIYPTIPKRILSESEKEKLDEYLSLHYECPPFLREFNLAGTTELELNTDETGCFKSLCVKKSVHHLFDKALLFSLENCPFPLFKTNRQESFLYKIQVHGNFTNAFDHPASMDAHYSKNLNQKSTNQCLEPLTVQPIQYRNFSKSSLDQKIRHQGFASLNEAETGYYFITSSKLGLVNCDHFFQDKKPKTTFTVRIDAPANSWIYMIFPSNKVIAQPFQSGNCGEFVNLPIGEKARIISFGKAGKQYFFKYMDVEITENGKVEKTLDPVSPVVFEKELTTLAEEFARL